MEKKELVCTVCPVGCVLTVNFAGETIEVGGYACRRGKVYGEDETLSPKRMLTTSVKLIDSAGVEHIVSVKTTEAVPKEKMWECLSEIKKISLTDSVDVEDVILKDILGLGIDVVATRKVDI